jgi:predicted RNase H-like HicB family nuclease
LVVYESGERNYSGYAPDVLGCAATGKTLEEMRTNMRDALAFHFEGMAEDGEQIPEPSTRTVDFSEESPEQGVSHCVVEWLDVPVPSPLREAGAA